MKAKTILIRRAVSSDRKDLAELVTDLGYPVNGEELWLRIEKMPHDTYQTFVALVENRVAGFIGLLNLPVYEHPHPIV